MFNKDKYTKRALTCLLMLGFVSATVNAQAAENKQATTYNQHKWYAGASFINAKLKPKVTTEKGKVVDDSSTGYKIYAGYNINDLFAIEAGYNDFGAAKVDTGTVSGDIGYKAYSVQGVIKKKLTKKIRVMGKLGFASLNNKAKKPLQLKKVNSTSVVFGFGGEYSINERLSIRAEYEHFDKDYQAVSIGLNAKFLSYK